MVRISAFSALEHRLLDMQALINAFENDPGLAGLNTADIPQIIQMVFICTGCDFVSFFNGVGKATFLNTLFEHSNFITASSANAPGSLTMTRLSSDGFYAFLRLVGCAYFKKYKSSFIPSHFTPIALYNSFLSDESSSQNRHCKWLSSIRDKIRTHIQYEENMMPSYEALVRHWKRACWVSSLWAQVTSNTMTYPPLQDYGWKNSIHKGLTIDWNSENITTEIRERVALIRKGCSCKKGC